MSTTREEFLMKMYDQMFADINQHIIVTWQCATALVGGLAVFALAEKGVLPVDFGAAIVVLLASWLLAHLLDASYWYNRNLVIISNIERLFLQDADLHKVHYYFGAHRPKNRMISHLRIQSALAIGLGGVILIYHFLTRVLPGMMVPGGSFEPARILPYLFAGVAAVFLWSLVRKYRANYAEFLENSPGITVDTTGIDYGGGHGYKKGENVVGGGAETTDKNGGNNARTTASDTAPQKG